MKRLFILGSGRSGTTMLQQALNRHSEILIPPETGLFCDVLGQPAWLQRRRLRQIEQDLAVRLPTRWRRIATPADAYILYQEIEESYARRLGREDAVYFGDKSPRHLLVASRLCALFPDAKFLLIYRDGRDVAVSMRRVPWAPRDIYLNFDWWLRSWKAQQWLQLEGNVALFCVRYEDLVHDPRKHLARITEFLGLDYEIAVADGSGNRTGILEREEWKSRAVQPITANRVNVWRGELSPSEVAVLERWGGTALHELGYELETDGQGPLPAFFHARLEIRRAVWRMSRVLELARQALTGRRGRTEPDS